VLVFSSVIVHPSITTVHLDGFYRQEMNRPNTGRSVLTAALGGPSAWRGILTAACRL
jgi:hypothetical protein